MAARVARLYPLHLLILFLFLATALASHLMEYSVTGRFSPLPLEGPRSLIALLANLFMVQGLDASRLSWNYPEWSVSVEFIAYLGFPFVLPVLWRADNRIRLVLAIILFSCLGLLSYVTTDHFDQWDGPLTLLRCLPEFLLGSLLYGLFRDDSPATLATDSVVFGLGVTAVAFLHFGAPDITIIPLFATLILALVSNKGLAASLLNTTPLVWLGNISYSLYLIHGLVQYEAISVLQGHGVRELKSLPASSSFMLLCLLIALCLFLATFTYYAVEITSRRYLRRLFETWRQSQGSMKATGTLPTASSP